MTTIVAIAAVQLVLLAIWVLATLLLRTADLRRAELRVARLRGFPFVSILAVAVAEPAILCTVGAALGVVAAWVAVVAARDILLYPSATVSVDLWVLTGFGAAILTIGAVLSVSALRLLRGSDLGETTAVARPTARPAPVVVDVATLVLSIVALVALATSGALASHGNPIASAAPGLLALGTAVIAIQLVLFACRRGVRATADSGSVSGFLALRQIVRRPALLREARVLIIALCLACFATSAWSVARSNRSTAATFSVGASTVATVTPEGVGLQQAVDRVDPAGRFAMAAVQIRTSSANLLAVDASRLPAVAAWPAGITRMDVDAVSRALRPATAPEVNLSGRPVDVQASVAASGAARYRLGTLELSLWVFNPQIGTSIVSLGQLHPGAHSYSGTLSTSCPGGCRLVGVGLVPVPGRATPSSGQIGLNLTRVTARSASGSEVSVPADLSAADWRATASGVRDRRGPAGGVSFAIPAALLASYESALGALASPMASIADHPVNLPGVAGADALYGASQSGAATTVASQGIDGNTVSIDPVVSASALPRLGSDAVMVDLTLLDRTQVDPAEPGSSDEVWLGPRAPANALARLRAAGLRIASVQRAQSVFNGLQRTGPALAYDFMLFATIVALLAAAASTLGVLAASTRRRAGEFTALEVTGVRRAVLVRSLAIESAILAVTALFGAVAGAVGAAMAIPSLPELSGAAVAPLSYALPAGLIVLVSFCVVLVVALTTAVAAGGVIRHMSPALLRAAASDLG